MKDELPYWLLLNRIPGMGPRRCAALLEKEKQLSNCFSGSQPTADFSAWCAEQGIKNPIVDWQGVEKDLAWAEKSHCTILTWAHPAYPHALKQVPSAPFVLFVRGDAKVLSTLQIAIVGSRTPTSVGRENAYHFAYELAQKGITVTSGLALGIDGASHEGALAAAGHTIAVLGNSLDLTYPAKHHTLAETIVAKGGAVVSEFPIGTAPKPDHFPRRNRVISGLSLGVLVVESALKSGSLITAHYAVEQGREVFALPGSIHNPLAKGCHQLIRQGAKCVENVTHILEEFPVHMFSHATLPLPVISPKKESQKQNRAPSSPILAHIGEVCTPIDDILVKTGLTLEQVSSMLLELELEQKVAATPGGYIRVNAMIEGI